MPPAFAFRPASDRALDRLLTAVANSIRWRILNELYDGDSLPVKEIARRVGVPRVNTSKHLAELRRAGLIEHPYETSYRLVSHFAVPGQRALDLGPIVIRLDQLPQKPPAKHKSPTPSGS